jgi:hypothetical protein
MAALICLTIGLLCALTARILLLIAALDISVWWALGVFLPFGPLLFRLSYPEAAQSSRIFRLATLGCLFLYILLGPGALVGGVHKTKAHEEPPQHGFAWEFAGKFMRSTSTSSKAEGRSLNERRAANAREFERLKKWNEALRLQKRDLLRSDVEGNRAYNTDLEEYNAALAAANAEKAVLATAAGAK